MEKSSLHDISFEIDQEMDLWNKYFLNKNAVNKEKIIFYYNDFCQSISKRVFFSRRVSGVDIRDCYQVSLLALMELIDRYDPERGALFKTYMTPVLKGKIHNFLDSCTEQASITSHNRKRKMERIQSLSLESGVEGGGDFDELVELTVLLAAAEFLNLSGDDVFENKEASSLVCDRYETPVDHSISCELWAVVDALLDPDKMVLIEHYKNQRFFNEIASFLSISVGRVSQIHTRALKQLYELYKSRPEVDKKA